MINAQDITWFMEVAERRHMTRAAERLGVTQPALSHWLNKLEDNLGRKLFYRHRQGMELTPFGERLKEEAHLLRQSWEDFFIAIEKDETELRARFRFGIHPSVALFALAPILESLAKRSNGITLQLEHGLSRHIAEDIVTRRLDVGIVVNPVRHPDLVIKELYRDRVGLWATSKKSAARLIYHPGLLQSHSLMKMIGHSELLHAPRLETESLEVAAHLALAGQGSAILPERVAHVLGKGKLQLIEEANVVDHHCLVYRSPLRDSPAGKVLLEAIRESRFD